MSFEVEDLHHFTCGGDDGRGSTYSGELRRRRRRLERGAPSAAAAAAFFLELLEQRAAPQRSLLLRAALLLLLAARPAAARILDFRRDVREPRFMRGLGRRFLADVTGYAAAGLRHAAGSGSVARKHLIE